MKLDNKKLNICQWQLVPANIIYFRAYLVEELMFLCERLEFFECLDVSFIHWAVFGRRECDLGLDTSCPLINRALDLEIELVSGLYKLNKKSYRSQY